MFPFTRYHAVETQLCDNTHHVLPYRSEWTNTLTRFTFHNFSLIISSKDDLENIAKTEKWRMKGQRAACCCVALLRRNNLHTVEPGTFHITTPHYPYILAPCEYTGVTRSLPFIVHQGRQVETSGTSGHLVTLTVLGCGNGSLSLPRRRCSTPRDLQGVRLAQGHASHLVR